MKRLLILLFTLCSMPAIADTQLPTYDRISLSVSAGEEVDNDTLIATLFVQREGNNPAQLASQVNKEISQAIATAKQHPEIKVQTLDYTTSPVYRNNTLSGWRVRQSIRIESQDATTISELIGALQTSLSLGSTQYTVSPEQRKKVEDGLISEAIQAFKARAQLISQEMTSSGYRVVQMNINGNAPSPRPYAMQGMALRAEAAPTLEAGSQRLEVHISGTIELMTN